MFFNITKKNEKPKNEGIERLKTALSADSYSCAGRIGGVVRSDVYGVLINYMDVDPQSVQLEIEAMPDGTYRIRLQAAAERIYNIGVPPVN